MRTFFKWLAAALLVVLIVIGALFLLLSSKGQSRVSAIYTFDVSVPDVPVDEALLARGAHVSQTWGCADCHGEDFSGQELIPSDNPIAYVVAPNITKGVGGLPSHYSDSDWIRATRFGVSSIGRPLILMNSGDWTTMSEYDVAALTAYMQQVPKVDKMQPISSLKPLGRVLAGAGQLRMWDAEHIDSSSKPQESMVPEATAEYGAYLANTCSGCHRADFKGGPSVMGPNAPAVPDLTATGASYAWPKEQLFVAITTGVTPSGHEMDPTQMPWRGFSHHTELELEALHAFFQSLD